LLEASARHCQQRSRQLLDPLPLANEHDVSNGDDIRTTGLGCFDKRHKNRFWATWQRYKLVRVDVPIDPKVKIGSIGDLVKQFSQRFTANGYLVRGC
jgi:hypothetical protein